MRQLRAIVFGAVLLCAASLRAATVDGLKIHSTSTGAGQTTVMLVHGYTCDETTWSEQVPALARQYRVITIDLPGHGKSQTPPVEKFSMELFARAIEAVRAEARADRVVLVGHSMGTPVILKYASLYPQHTEAIVAVDGVMLGGPAVSGRGAGMGGPNGAKAREAMVQRFFVAGTPPAVKEKVLRMMLGAPEPTAVGAMNATFEAAARTTPTQIPNVPVLALYAGSPLANRETVLSQLPNAEYVQIPGTGHFLMLEQPAEFNRLLLGFLAKQNGSAPPRAAAAACDRECLRGKVTQVLWALVKHNVKGLPVAETVRVTEDAVEKPLDKVGLVNTLTRLRGYRQDVIDERAGVVAASVVAEEVGAPVLLVVRLKVVADKMTEIELVATRSRADGLIFNIDGFSAASAGMNYVPRPEQLPTREDALKAALKYPEGLAAAKTFAAVNAPFAADAYRYENGQIMAGPDCKFARGCENISTQSLQIFERLGAPETRVVAVDERMGIVLLRMAWGVREKGGDQLTAFESFKVYDGQIHAVEAFIRILPIEKRNGGWQ